MFRARRLRSRRSRVWTIVRDGERRARARSKISDPTPTKVHQKIKEYTYLSRICLNNCTAELTGQHDKHCSLFAQRYIIIVWKKKFHPRPPPPSFRRAATTHRPRAPAGRSRGRDRSNRSRNRVSLLYYYYRRHYRRFFFFIIIPVRCIFRVVRCTNIAGPPRRPAAAHTARPTSAAAAVDSTAVNKLPPTTAGQHVIP